MKTVTRSFRGLGVALLAALSLMAFAATSAQATWDINGKEITQNEKINGKLKELFGKLLLPGLNIEIRCHKLTVELTSVLRALPNLDALALLEFSECFTHLISTGVVQPSCKPTVLLVNAKIVQILHNNNIKLLALPKEGTKFTGIDFPETCALTETNNVTGSVVFECEDGALKLRSCGVSAVRQLIKPVSHATQLSLYPTDVLKFGGQVALLDGEAEVFIHEGAPGFNQPFNALI